MVISRRLMVVLPFLFYICGSTKYRAPIFESVSGDIYHGTLKESDVVLSLSPEIRIINTTGPVCRYVTEKYHHPGDTSDDIGDWSSAFDVIVKNKMAGSVELRLKKGLSLDCSDSPYRFYMRAERCDDLNMSDKILVEVRIADTNNHEPRFERDFYAVDAEPARLYDVLVQLRAFDADCGHPYGEVCRYEIQGEASRKLFHISESGVLRNIEPLNASHVISVRAFDCGMRQSASPAIVRVNVNTSSVVAPVSVVPPPGPGSMCHPGLNGLAERLEYEPGQRALSLFPSVTLDLCDSLNENDRLVQPNKLPPKNYLTTKKTGVTCPNGVAQLEAKISLLGDTESNELTSQYCDRENLSLDAQKKTCGADKETIELLPNAKSVHIENETSPKGTVASVENIYMFDGKSNAVIVPETTTDGNFSDTFSVNFWMRREKPRRPITTPLDQKQSHWAKENILCLSDDHRMNRHHFSIYAKHCKLEVLIRRERSTNGKHKKSSDLDDQNQLYEPAEWRWRLGQVCDNNWHHYALRVTFPKIELLVDGVSVELKDGNSPEILDDWPMHHVKDLKNRLVIGACWQGSTGKTYQHFKGYLSGVTVLSRKIEKSSVLDCFLQCKERLEFVGLAKLELGEEAIFNRDMNDLTLKAKKVADFTDMLTKVSYINSKAQPTVGDRFVRLMPTVICNGENSAPVLLPVVESRVVVKTSSDVVELRLKASKFILDYTEYDVSNKGVPLFPDLKILTIRENKAIENHDQDTLDDCKVTSEPELDKTREFFSSPSTLIGSIPNLDFEQLTHGLMVKGQATLRDYEKILEQIHYFNSRPNQISRRVFSVRCSMYAGRIRSNEFIVTVNIVHKEIGGNQTKSTNFTTEELLPMEQPNPDSPHRIVAKKKPLLDEKASNGKPEKKHEDTSDNEEEEVKPSFANIRKLEMMAVEPRIVAVGGHDPLGYDTFSPVMQSGTGGAMAVVAVVCVGFLVLLVVLGVLKVRQTQHRLQRVTTSTKLRARRRSSSNTNSSTGGVAANGTQVPGQHDLTWDDDGMTITVNPIDPVIPSEQPINEEMYSDMSSDEDSLADEQFSDEDDEDDEQVLPHLESNSQLGALKFGAGSTRRQSASALPAQPAKKSEEGAHHNLEWDDEAPASFKV